MTGWVRNGVVRYTLGVGRLREERGVPETRR